MAIRDYKSTILVSGSHRSGSTWLGQMLNLGSDAAYLHEPFNIGLDRIKEQNCPLIHTFQYVKNTNIELETYLDRVDSKLTKKKGTQEANTLIIKDPIAMMSGKWFEDTYNSKVIMLIRHPAAFVASLKIKSWYFDFNNFRRQESLMDDVLFPFRNKIEYYCKRPQDIINQGILLWNIIYYRIRLYELSHPNWFFLRHEDLSLDPLAELKRLYTNLELEYTDDIAREIKKAVQPSIKTEFKRDSKSNIFTWKDRLSGEEIELIRKETKEISDLYYSETDWNPNIDQDKSKDTRPQQIENRKILNTSGLFNIDSISGATISSDNPVIEVDRSDNIVIRGWALNNDKEANVRGVFLQIGSQYYETTYGFPRPDVARFYKNKDIVKCGFELVTPCKNMVKGRNGVKIYILSDSEYTEQFYRTDIIVSG